MKKTHLQFLTTALVALFVFSSCIAQRTNCCSKSDPRSAKIEGAWTVLKIYGKKPQLEEPMTVTFSGKENWVSCMGVCNSMGGNLSLGDNGAIRMENFVSTRVACSFMSYEGQLVGALTSAARYKRSWNSLFLYDAQGVEVLKLKYIKPEKK